MMKNFISHLSLILALHTVSANAHATNRCEDLFSPTSTAKTQNKSLTLTNESWEQFYKKTYLNPRPALLLKIRQSLEKHVTHLQNPLETAGTDANRIGAVYKSMVLELPLLKTLIEADRLPKLSHADFITLKRLAAIQIISISHKPNSALQVFASLEALKYISSIESRVEFPRTKEEIEK